MVGGKFGPYVQRDDLVGEDPASESAEAFGFEEGFRGVGLRTRGSQHGHSAAAT
jgi:hypothetical protein